MGKSVIEFAIGINKEKKTIGLKFPRPTMMLEFGAADALELAKQLILRAKEIHDSKNMVSEFNEIGKLIQ